MQTTDRAAKSPAPTPTGRTAPPISGWRDAIVKAGARPSLRVGGATDPAEVEADRIAERVMSMRAEPLASLPPAAPSPAISSILRPQSAAPGSALRRKTLPTASPASANGGSLPGAAARVVRALGPGKPLPPSERAFFEPRFGSDLGGVTIHDGPAADAAAASIGARAFALGNSVAFADREYRPGSVEGRRLLAHELAHIGQAGDNQTIRRLIRSPYPWRGVITPSRGANLRSAPDSSDAANILFAIPPGEFVTVLSVTGDWLRVRSRWTGPAVEGYIHHTLVDDAASRAMERSVGTTMVWRPSGPGSGTDFETWASAPTETPFPAVTATTVMNCWEAVLLSAYRAGSIDWAWLHNVYTVVPVSGWADAMSRGTKHVYAVPGPNMSLPQRGDIVFFDGIAHVGLATGNGSDVYTFWPPPDTPFKAGGTTDKVKVFTIEALVAWWAAHMPPAPVVEFATPNW